MIYTLSELMESVKTEDGLRAWIEQKVEEIRLAAHENRDENNRREFREETDAFRTLQYAWAPLKALRARSAAYDVSVTIDRKGYHTFYARFPVTYDQLREAHELRLKYIRESGIPSCCVYIWEWFWKCFKDQFRRDFDFLDESAETKHNVEDTSTATVKKVEVFRFKKI